MGRDLEQTIEKEKEWFSILEPELKKHFFKGGFFYMVENNKQCDFNYYLDCNAGIDIWYCSDSKYIVGIASRIQKYKKNKYGRVVEYKTFTIRKKRESGVKTEYEKRKDAMAFGYIYPKYTVQAYLSEDKDTIKAFAIAKTRDILEYISKNDKLTNNTGADQIGQAEFYVIDWYKFKESNFDIFIKEYMVSNTAEGDL